MKVEVRRLREVMELVAPVIPREPGMAIVKHILLRDGKAIATDLQHTIIMDFPEATGELLLHRDALDFLKFIPGDTMAEISIRENDIKSILISCEGSRRSLPWADVQDFPPLPVLPDIQWHLDGDRLQETLVMASAYAGRDQSRPVLAGITLTLEEDQSFVASGDGYRMFYREIPETSESTITVIIPIGTVRLLRDLWKKASRPEAPATDALITEIALARRLIGLGIRMEDKGNRVEGLMVARFGGITLLSRLITGTSPDWRGVIPLNPPQKLKVFAEDLYRALQQVREVAGENGGIMRLHWDDNRLKVTATAGEQTAEAEAFATIEGGGGHIGFNIRYLTEYLKHRQGLVEMGVTSPGQSVCFLDGKCTVVIMPVAVSEDTRGEASDQTREETQTSQGRGAGEGDDVSEETNGDEPEEVETPEHPREKKGAIRTGNAPARTKRQSRSGKARK